jgi:sphingosine kinase
MMQALQLRRNETNKSISSLVTEDVTSGAMPPLKYSIDDTDGWITIDEPILYLYAGKGPYVGR